MTWKENPKIRDLEPYCKKHKYKYMVTFCVTEDEKSFDVNTYGRTKPLCKLAALAGKKLLQLAEEGVFPDFPKEKPKGF